MPVHELQHPVLGCHLEQVLPVNASLKQCFDPVRALPTSEGTRAQQTSNWYSDRLVIAATVLGASRKVFFLQPPYNLGNAWSALWDHSRHCGGQLLRRNICFAKS